ncbi:MAG: AAA family ATPase [Asticcacaulis sp.]
MPYLARGGVYACPASGFAALYLLNSVAGIMTDDDIRIIEAGASDLSFMKEDYSAALALIAAHEGRWPEAEPLIAAGSADLALFYAQTIIKGPWPEGERAILTDGSCAQQYATRVLRSRWPVAEPIILSDARAAMYYAWWALEARWPEFETKLLAEGFEGYGRHGMIAYEYAVEFFPDGWPEAEFLIARDAQGASGYARMILGEPWPLAEAAIAADPIWCIEYAERFYGRWEKCEPVLLSELRGRWGRVGPAFSYACRALKQRWPEAEDALLQQLAAGTDIDAYGRENITHYRDMFRGGHWPEVEARLDLPKPRPGLALAAQRGLDAIFAELDALIGLQAVKTELRKIAAAAHMAKIRRERGMKSMGMSLHLVFSGKPGTGKTTVARLVGEIYRELGLLEKGHVIEADRAALVGQFLGQTAVRTKEKCEEAYGGLLFVDEAYTLSPPTRFHDYGSEAIDTLVTEMENNRSILSVIAAGYPEDMERFLEANAGLKSRFGRVILFEDYTPEDMLEIFRKMSRDNDYTVSPEAEDKVFGLFADAYANRDKSFSNGRFVRNVLERTMERHSLRFMDDPEMDIQLIVADDIPEDMSA